MKSLILASAVALGIAFTAGTADAQYRRGGVVYSYPAYSAPTYTYVAPYYGTPSGVYATPAVYTNGYAPVVYDSSFYAPSYYGSPYSNNTYYGGQYYNSSNYGYPYSNYTGVTGTGVYYGGRRIIRW
jgi:hypothetical protein